MRVLFKLPAIAVLVLLAIVLTSPSLFAGTLIVTSPVANSANSGAVHVIASATETIAFHYEIWDNGTKLGDVMTSPVNTTYSLAAGSHVMTVLAVSNAGAILQSSAISYKVADSSAPDALTIVSPVPGSTSANAVRITASANEATPFHLEVWDNGYKLGNIAASSVNGVYVLPTGPHVMTVQAIATDGALLSRSNVSYTVAQSCTTSSTVQCNLDQQAIDDTQNDCSPPEEAKWIANPCGGGVQGIGGAVPLTTGIQAITETGVIPDQENTTLNGHSLHLWETQASPPSNVLFRGQSANSLGTKTVDTHWTMDEYVYLPNPAAHQAFEMDAQASMNGIWTKFYTECAFNISSGTGYWGVFDSDTGGWIFLNGKSQNGQTPPVVPCDRSQFAQPWSGSSNPSFTGWHHIAWTFLRNPDGTVTFETLTFDNTTTQVNFKPVSASGGAVNDSGNFSALIQLDGVVNTNRLANLVDAYVSQITLTHTP